MVDPLNEIMEIKFRQIKSEIEMKSLSMLQRMIRIESMLNLTNYTNTGAKPRDSMITEAFSLMKTLIGFEYNPNGSFTHSGARDAFEYYVTAQEGTLRLKYNVEGRLEEMEEGKTDWDNMKRFFYSKKWKAAVYRIFPNSASDFYKRLEKLFNQTQDPTMPSGRKYISSALEDGSEYLDELIRHEINSSFNNNGIWIKGNPKRRSK